MGGGEARLLLADKSQVGRTIIPERDVTYCIDNSERDNLAVIGDTLSQYQLGGRTPIVLIAISLVLSIELVFLGPGLYGLLTLEFDAVTWQFFRTDL